MLTRKSSKGGPSLPAVNKTSIQSGRNSGGGPLWAVRKVDLGLTAYRAGAICKEVRSGYSPQDFPRLLRKDVEIDNS
jgi:hypothetical protein